jgi:hypothetical protein
MKAFKPAGEGGGKMTLDPSEAAVSLRDIASVEQRTREAVFYGGSSAIFILWGVLAIVGHALAELYPRSAGVTWLGVSAAGCAATALIIAARTRARPQEERDWRLICAMIALTAFGATWSFILGPVVPRHLLYAFQPSLVLLGMILAGLWLGRFFVVLGVAGIVLILAGQFQAEPWSHLWIAAVQSGTLILGGVWLHRNGVPR